MKLRMSIDLLIVVSMLVIRFQMLIIPIFKSEVSHIVNNGVVKKQELFTLTVSDLLKI